VRYIVTMYQNGENIPNDHEITEWPLNIVYDRMKYSK
jgi:hypothetical protein